MAALAIPGYRLVKNEIQNNLRHQLQATLNANVEAFKMWRQDKIKDAQVLADIPGIRSRILSLAQKINGKGQEWSRKKILALPEAQFLQKTLGHSSQQQGFIGFVLIDKSGFQMLALLDEATAKRDLESMGFVRNTLNGRPSLSPPILSEIPLPDIKGQIHPVYPTMFSTVPIRDDSGAVAAALLFRIRPEVEFSRLMSVSHFGKTGETYAFDSRGTLLSESRFNEQLKTHGLLIHPAMPHSTLNLDIRDPGGNLLEQFAPSLSRDKQPLTLMAREATQGNSGINVDGYNDYRGVPVVGAWTWLADAGFGMATEIDISEGFSPVNELLKVFGGLLGLLSLAMVMALFSNWRKRRAEFHRDRLNRLKIERENLLNTLVDRVIDGVITIDQKGIIQTFNPAAEKIFGYAPDELIGKNVRCLMEGVNFKNHDEYIKNYLNTGIPKIIGIGREVIGRRKDNTLFPIDLAISQHEVGEDIWFTGICRDITDRKKREEEILRAQKEAEQANEAKSQFLSRMSHELRTPLNAIQGFGQLLDLDRDTTSKQRQCVSQILGSSKLLLDLINDILDLSRIETGDLTLSLEPLPVSDLIQDLLPLTLPLASESGIQMTNQIPENCAHWIMADRTRIKQILLNLITNAIKYNQPGGNITLTCSQAENGFFQLTVADTGAGLSKEQLSRLFRPFERLGAEKTDIKGTGIGLTICKDLAEKMHGFISVESQVGKGSRFTLSIPEVPKPLSILNDFLPTKQCSKGHMKPHSSQILYIEDNPSNQMLMTQIFRSSENLELATATDGEEGLRMALELKPDLILLDINLPGIDGFETFKRLKADSTTQEIPILAISANAMKSDIEKAMNLGFKDYITKPIHVESLMEKINSHLTRTLH